MPVKYYKPVTPGQRNKTSQDLSMITTSKPVKSLLRIKKSKAGRNNKGRITIRHRGGGVKRFYRLVNFKPQDGFKGVVEHIEYDPNRSARLARVKDDKGAYHYFIAGNDMRVGQSIQVGSSASISSGNRLSLRDIPSGSIVYNVELQPGKGGQIARSAGTKVQLTAKEGSYGLLKLPSGEIRKVHLDCQASLGVVGNEQHQNVKLGSAGRRRKMGWRPSVHGKAMNPSDHPMGGGEGRTGPGRHPKTPWGKPAIGYKTRRRKSSNKFIVRSRHASKRK